MRRSPLVVAVLLLVLATGAARAQYFIPSKTYSYDWIDQQALKTPKFAEKSLDTLARHLTSQARDEREKVRAIFCWVAHNITYDETQVRKLKRNLSAEELLDSRRGVCGCYVNLVKALCDRAGVPCAIVYGHSKNPGDPPGTDYRKNRHAWNAVKIDGKWHLMDVTWASGRNVNGRYEHRFDDVHFLMPPEQFIFTHFPQDPRWQLLAEPVSYEEFARLAGVPATFFQLGFGADEVRRRVREGSLKELVRTYTLPPGLKVRVMQAPIDRKLPVGNTYRIVIEGGGLRGALIRAGNQVQRLEKVGNNFETAYRVPAGPIDVFVAQPHPSDPQSLRYVAVMSYEGVYGVP